MRLLRILATIPIIMALIVGLFNNFNIDMYTKILLFILAILGLICVCITSFIEGINSKNETK